MTTGHYDNCTDPEIEMKVNKNNHVYFTDIYRSQAIWCLLCVRRQFDCNLRDWLASTWHYFAVWKF